MFFKTDRGRDVLATGIILCGAMVMFAGGAVSSLQSENTGPLHAGATIESEAATDVFDRGTNKVMEELATPPFQRTVVEREEADQSAATTPQSLTASQADDGNRDTRATSVTSDAEAQEASPDDSTTLATDDVNLEPTAPKTVEPDTRNSTVQTEVTRQPVNPVERDATPLDEMSKEQIQERLADYRAWVHKGQIAIELDLTRLDSDHVEYLVDFYVLQTDDTKLAIDTTGKALQLSEIPSGRLVTDLNDRRHWPSFTRKWSGSGPTNTTMAIVLNDRAELHLYRILVDGVAERSPQPGTTVFVGITVGDDGRLYFAVLKCNPPHLTEQE